MTRLRTDLEELGARQAAQQELVERRTSKASLEEQVLSSQLRLSAMNLLARRDHSRCELEDKLTRKKQRLIDLALKKLEEKSAKSFSQSFDGEIEDADAKGVGQSPVISEQSLTDQFPACLNASLAQLEEDQLLDDQRFAESYIRWRARSGFGPLRIKNELQQRGVEVAWSQLNAVAWEDEVCAVRKKKFGEALPKDMAGRAKQIRFLTYRGFPQDLITRCLDPRRV